MINSETQDGDIRRPYGVSATDETPDSPKLHFLKYNKYPRTDLATAFAHSIRDEISNSEERVKKRRPADELRFEQQVSALVSEIAYHIIQDDGTQLMFNRSAEKLGKRNAYQAAFVTKKVANVVDALEGLGLITQVIGRKHPNAWRGIASTITPTDALIALIAERGLTLEDFKTLRPRQPIVMKAPKERNAKGKRIDYDETPATRRLRKEVEEINQWIAEADIRFDPEFDNGRLVDTSKTYLSRHFTGSSFRYHGRLYGAFWQELSKDQRRHGITINGEKVVALDYSNTMLRLAYGHAKASLPDVDDLYAIPPYDKPEFRDGIKSFVSALFFQEQPMRRIPKEIASILPVKMDTQSFKECIKHYHSDIAHLLDTNIGHELWITESNLIIEVLRRLRAMRIVALPVHDCIIVPVSAKYMATRVMEEAGKTLVGVPMSVKPE